MHSGSCRDFESSFNNVNIKLKLSCTMKFSNRSEPSTEGLSEDHNFTVYLWQGTMHVPDICMSLGPQHAIPLTVQDTADAALQCHTHPISTGPHLQRGGLHRQLLENAYQGAARAHALQLVSHSAMLLLWSFFISHVSLSNSMVSSTFARS